MALYGTGSSTNTWTGVFPQFTGAMKPAWVSFWIKGPATFPTGNNFVALYRGLSMSSVGVGSPNMSWYERDDANNQVYTGIAAGSVLNNGNWHHIVADWESTTARNFYIDGKFYGTWTNAGITAQNFERFIIGLGNNPNALPTNIQIAEILVALGRPTQAGVDEIVSGVNPLDSVDAKTSQLLGYWPLRGNFKDFGPFRNDIAPWGTPGAPVWGEHPNVAISQKNRVFRVTAVAPTNATGVSTFGATDAQGTASAQDAATGAASFGATGAQATATVGPNTATATLGFGAMGTQAAAASGPNAATSTGTFGPTDAQATVTQGAAANGVATFGSTDAQATASLQDPATGMATFGSTSAVAQATAQPPDNAATATLIYGPLGVVAVAAATQGATGTATSPGMGATGTAGQEIVAGGQATFGGLQTVASSAPLPNPARGGGTFGAFTAAALPPRAFTTSTGEVANSSLVNPTLDQLFQGFLDLMPRGPAWPKEEDSTMRRMLRPLLNTYLRLIQRDNNLLTDAFPNTTQELLPEWEASLGLPDPCTGPTATIAQRRGQVVARLISGGGQNVAFFVQYAAQLGFHIEIEQYTPAVAGVAQAGTPDYGEAWAHAWAVHGAQNEEYDALAGAAHAGDPLRSWGNAVLECELGRLSPAHSVLTFAYDL